MGEPNVLILDEPTNDLDTDMLAAMEDLLDSWPGTLIVVTHDRYLLERVTDMQYALLGDGHLRHLPGGVDEYLKLRRLSLAAKPESKPTNAQVSSALSGAEKRDAEKNLSRIERALEKLAAEETELHTRMAAHDQSDYAGLGELAAKQQELNEKRENLELEWLETTERLS
jgi:ABC-type multidrug transport system ATPase subunit